MRVVNQPVENAISQRLNGFSSRFSPQHCKGSELWSILQALEQIHHPDLQCLSQQRQAGQRHIQLSPLKRPNLCAVKTI
jgi:hypothetical protein